jgi:predicted esterase
MITAMLVTVLLCAPGSLPAAGRMQATSFPWTKYEEMRAKVGELFQQQKYAEMAAILEPALDRFPDHLRANCYNLALARVRLGRPDQGLQALQQGLDRGIWYGKYDFTGEVWTPLRKLAGYPEFERQNRVRLQEAQKQVKPRLDIATPEGYSASRKYPLFIALHGGGENVDVFRPQWTSALLKREYIVAYPQSTALIAKDGYNWTEDIPLSLKEIREAYEKVMRNYSIDASRIIVGGFSSGGVAALEIVLNETLPVAGFVVLCPAKPDDFTPGKVAAAHKRGVRGTLMTTEMDGRLEAQKQMAEIMKSQGLSHEFIITPNIGHWYPDDLGSKIDAAIVRILQ